MRQDDRLWQTSDPFLLRLVLRNIPLLLFLLLASAGMMTAYSYFSPTSLVLASGDTARSGEVVRAAPILKSVFGRPVLQRFAQSPAPVRIGLISGHMNNDSGAVCDDGLTEAQINLDIALRTADLLRAQGYRVNILAEFDPRLTDFVGDALVSIHADSCAYVGEQATGFKLSASPFSDSVDLGSCIESRYAAVTDLDYHANTITPDMVDYHAFREIASTTPAVIIEVGFMNLDRELLTTNAALPAQGIANGILCFMGDDS